MAVYDDRIGSSRLPYYTADLGFAQTIHAYPFDRRRRRAEEARRIDPIKYPALW